MMDRIAPHLHVPCPHHHYQKRTLPKPSQVEVARMACWCDWCAVVGTVDPPPKLIVL